MNLPLPKRALRLLAIPVLVGVLALPSSLFAALGEVSVSGSTWTGKIDGVTRYTGSSMAGAVNACSSTGTCRS